jgi:vitamin B12 transporter
LLLVFVDTNSGGRNLLSVPYFSKSLHSKNPFKNHFFASLLALSVLPSTVLSSETKNLDEIVVKGLRINTTLEESGSSISILTNEMIKARGYVFALDALASASGVTIKQNGPFGGQASARIRGSASQQTLVLVDGMVVNDTTSPGGGFNFGGYDASNIERIEVLKGPQSTLWGSDAMGGVVNIITREPDSKMAGSVFAEAGSERYQRLGAEIETGGSWGGVRLSVADLSTDGISKADEADGNREEDGFGNQIISMAGRFNLGDDARMGFNLRREDSDADFDSFGVVTGVVDGDENSESLQRTASIFIEGSFFGGRLDNYLSVGYADIDRQSFSAGVSSFGSEGERTTLRYTGSVALNDSNQMTFGYEDETSESGSTETDTNGVFLLYKTTPVENLSLTFGVRRDDHDDIDSVTNGRVTASWKVNELVRLKSSWGEGFKKPSLFQTTFFCCGATAANPNLLAEESEAWDVGINLSFSNGGQLGLTYFDQDTDNLITFSFGIGGYENIAKARSTGLEVDGQFDLTESLFVSANVTYLDLEDENGDRLIRAPRLAGELSLSYRQSEQLTLSFITTFNGDEADPRDTVPGWGRTDITAQYQVSESVELFARFENLFDKQYQQIFGYGTQGLSGRAGVRMSF